VIGKPIGVYFSTYLANKVKLGEFPAGARRVDVLATGSAAGVGFTVAIFIANLAFDTPAVQELAVFAVIVASVVSGLLSLAMFKFLGRKS
jgi:NhaA family Na+:H+ antiporter